MLFRSAVIARSAADEAILSESRLPRPSDALGARNDTQKITYKDIVMPKNTAIGIYISACTFFFGFAFVWHIWWLVIASAIGAIVCLIVRSFDEETEYVITAVEVEKIESINKSSTFPM